MGPDHVHGGGSSAGAGGGPITKSWTWLRASRLDRSSPCSSRVILQMSTCARYSPAGSTSRIPSISSRPVIRTGSCIGLRSFPSPEGLPVAVADHGGRRLGVDLRRGDGGMPEKPLHLLERHPPFEEVLRNGVPHQVGIDPLRDAGAGGELLDDLLHAALREGPPRAAAEQRDVAGQAAEIGGELVGQG